MFPRSALTLIELLVVLVILVALTTVAAQSLEPKINQARFDSTKQTMTNLDAAILGDSSLQTNGSAAITGFVADIGALPATLNDLLVKGTMPNPATQAATGQATIVLTRGWRGPYLRLPPGSTTALDGWGNAFTFTPTTVANGNDYLRIVSKGSDGVTGQSNSSDLYTADLTLDLPLVSITGNVVNSSGSPVSSATVTLYIPDPSPTATALKAISDNDNSNSNATFTFSDVPIGTRVIRATSSTLSGIVYLNVPRTGLTNVVVTVK